MSSTDITEQRIRRFAPYGRFAMRWAVPIGMKQGTVFACIYVALREIHVISPL